MRRTSDVPECLLRPWWVTIVYRRVHDVRFCTDVASASWGRSHGLTPSTPKKRLRVNHNVPVRAHLKAISCIHPYRQTVRVYASLQEPSVFRSCICSFPDRQMFARPGGKELMTMMYTTQVLASTLAWLALYFTVCTKFTSFS